MPRIFPLALAATLALTLLPGASYADKAAGLAFGADSKLWIEGDSTLHRYHSTARSWKLTASLAADQAGFTRLEAVVPVKELKSGDGGLDKNLYATLKADQFPTIRFSAARGRLSRSANGAIAADVDGRLTIAGVERAVSVHAEGKLTGDTVRLAGVETVKMSDYGIQPPVLMLGAIKCSDPIEVHFELVGQLN